MTHEFGETSRRSARWTQTRAEADEGARLEIALAVCDGPRFQLRLRPSTGGLGPNHQINVTVEHLQQGQDLIDRLAVVRLIEKAIQLRRRRPESLILKRRDVRVVEGARLESETGDVH